MRHVPLERDINIAVNGCSGFATSTQKGPFMAMSISHSRGTYLITYSHPKLQCKNLLGHLAHGSKLKKEGFFSIDLQGAMTFFTELIFEKAKCSINAADCALIIGVTYFLSSILGLVLKKHIGRRVLLLGDNTVLSWNADESYVILWLFTLNHMLSSGQRNGC